MMTMMSASTRLSSVGRIYQSSRAISRSSSRALSTIRMGVGSRRASIITTTQTYTQRRTLAVYAVGEGWTGALGTGRLDETIVGHDDDDYDYDDTDDNDKSLGLPVRIYDAPVHSAAVGWGHTAVIDIHTTADNTNNNTSHTLLVTGRPHDFSALLRLQRMPTILRDYMVRQTVNSINPADDIHPAALVGRFVTFLTQVFSTLEQQREWEIGAQYSVLPALAAVALPDNDTPVLVVCSAGLTACIGAKAGTLYTFGLNNFGQCGIGHTSNNVWVPTPVTGLSVEFAASGPRSELPQSHRMTSVALGLQHGVALNEAGQVFSWGKGDRGQLGQEAVTSETDTATPIRKAFSMGSDGQPTPFALGPVKQIASGMLHSCLLTEDNQVAIWGKHVLRPLSDDKSKVALDSRIPAVLTGLPEGLIVEQIACGSHHTALLLSDGSVWAVGISSDTKQPILDPVELIPKGTIELPVRQFAAHMDRTTVVGAGGRQVLQVHLWEDPELREYAIFTPPYIDRLLDENKSTRIREIHRSWKHTVIVTD
jgi:hypothetical protein